jgi:hypothetical protein
VQWVPHGYGRRGLNVGFSRWIARRARAGDVVDVIVHEPFVDYFGGSWIQPARALVQRYMTRTLLRAAHRVFVTIPGWQPRLDSLGLELRQPLRVLPVPGTIPVDPDLPQVRQLREALLGPATHLVGYFGAGGDYALEALRAAASRLNGDGAGCAFVCIGKGSGDVARSLAGDGTIRAGLVRATGTLGGAELSRHLQACDVLVQPYVDGVSGRRTTTVSALEHGIPVATTFGRLSEPFWQDAAGIAVVPADHPERLGDVVSALLEPSRNRAARTAARKFYETHFAPAVALAPVFGE